MPSKDTFDCKPIGALVRKYLQESQVSIDPFARNKRWATYTNDLNPNTAADYHMNAPDFLRMLADQNVKADLLIFDPPYSPRQITECYSEAGLKAGMIETQNARLYSECRDTAMSILTEGAIVISCGWNSAGMGASRGFDLQEILMVCHGGAHNDTIVVVEKRDSRQHELFVA